MNRLGSVFARARNWKGYTQEQLSMELPMSREAISKAETGARKIPKDLRSITVKELDYPFYSMAVAYEDTAGAWVPELDGEAVDLHRSSVKSKTIEELNEALEALNRVCVSNHPGYIQEHQKHELEEALIQVIDAIIALSHYLAIICLDYGFSWLKLWKKQHLKLRSKGFVKGRY
jgi:transcriptional regulator with XRE-family HTH domain